MADTTALDLLGLFHRVERLSHRKKENSNGECENFRGRGRILATLYREDGLSQKILAERLDIRPQSLSETIVKLAEDGLVERISCENDKREILVYITDAGRVRAEQIRAWREAFAKEFFSVLDKSEMSAFKNILEKLECDINSKSCMHKECENKAKGDENT